MKKQIIITVVACISMAYGCSDPITKENNETVKAQQEPISASTETEHHHNEGASIELNNGHKWKIEVEMMKYITNMQSDVKLFSEANNKNLNDYAILGAGLQKNVDLLTSNCTMKGKAHDELHKWLLPYIDMVDKFNKSKNESDNQAIFKEIENSFVLFNQYFE
ncbi:MAG: hypothetical protein Q7W13_02930 [Bacteroidia bacterium]|nr:hypothetical protein [Bacteroidia bacterium]